MNTRHKMMVTKKPQGVMSTDTREVMLSKFKVKSVGGGSFLTYFHHNRAQSCTLAQTQPSLIEVYEAEIRRLREENHNLRIRHNSMATQLNEVIAQLQQANLKLCCCDQFIFKSRKMMWVDFIRHEKRKSMN